MQSQAHTDAVQTDERVIEISKLSTRFGKHVVHSELDLEVRRGEVFALVGGSGSGKSTLLREMILLRRPDSGSIRVLGVDLQKLDDDAALALRQRWGVMFQHGGLFGSLTVAENVGLPLREHTGLEDGLVEEIAASKLAMTGLEPEVGAQYPSELSGGMMKRASLARALALDPELLFLDEPTAGLDPDGREEMLDLVTRLEDFGINAVISSHVLTDIERTCDWVIMLDGGHVLRSGPLSDLSTTDEAELEVIGDLDAVAAAAERLGAVVQREGSSLVITRSDGDAFDIARDAVVAAGAAIRRLGARRTTLEDVFLGAGGGDG